MTSSIYTIVICLVLGAAMLLAIRRLVTGPDAVDRAVANEVFVSTLVCALGVEAALNRHDTTLPILLSLSLVGFLGSVSIARFVGRQHDRTQLGDDSLDDTQLEARR